MRLLTNIINGFITFTAAITMTIIGYPIDTIPYWIIMCLLFGMMINNIVSK